MENEEPDALTVLKMLAVVLAVPPTQLPLALPVAEAASLLLPPLLRLPTRVPDALALPEGDRMALLLALAKPTVAEPPPPLVAVPPPPLPVAHALSLCEEDGQVELLVDTDATPL